MALDDNDSSNYLFHVGGLFGINRIEVETKLAAPNNLYLPVRVCIFMTNVAADQRFQIHIVCYPI